MQSIAAGATEFQERSRLPYALVWLIGVAAQLLPLGYWAGQLGAFR